MERAQEFRPREEERREKWLRKMGKRLGKEMVGKCGPMGLCQVYSTFDFCGQLSWLDSNWVVGICCTTKTLNGPRLLRYNF